MGRLDNPALRAEVDVQIDADPVVTYFAHVPYDVCEKWSRQDVGDAGGAHLPFDYFKVGEGGWVEASGGAKVRREPEPSLSDLDCIENPDRYPGAASERYVFSKSLDSVSYESAQRAARGDGTIATTEANDDGSGSNPDFWEVACFDSGDNMVVYATIEKLTKDSSKTVSLVFRIYR